MDIRIDQHAKERAEERGASTTEIFEALTSGVLLPAKTGRLSREKVFSYRSEWNGKFYEEKLLKVIYLIDGKTIIVITVVVKYGKFTIA
jgi:hypothetical protein